MKHTIKKISLTLVLVSFVTLCAAQDTVSWRSVPVHYLNNNWFDTTMVDSNLYVPFAEMAPELANAAFGVVKYADSSLDVYGIAAGLLLPKDWAPDEDYLTEMAAGIEDTTLAGLRDERLRLYELSGDSVWQVGPDLLVNLGSSQPSYYWDLRLNTPSGNPYYICPIYERYFDSPVMVQDSFLVGKGIVNGILLHKADQTGYLYNTWKVQIPTFTVISDDYEEVFPAGTRTMYYYPEGNHVGWYFNNVLDAGYLLIFPIIAPNPDTVRGGEDDTTAAVRPMSAVERNTVVSPNPATGVVQVSSGFGLTAIEAYDAAGTKVHEQPAEGLKARVDVSRWPRGTYLLRIHTPVGTATKRLVVQ